ncbi:MAG: hypothetical protein Q9184_005229 [Pyrenodesmia sp. 2 TL-2023]
MSIPTFSLPTTRTQLTALFASFPQNPSPSSEVTANPLIHAPLSVKSLLLTLHVLFPNELLPALDLLDRKLVTKLVLNDGSAEGVDAAAHVDGGPPSLTKPLEDVEEGIGSVYYVRSSQQPRSSRFSSGRMYDAFTVSGQQYEVRLRAWNCSCPAFALAWVGCLGDSALEGLDIDDGGAGAEAGAEKMGGEDVEGRGKERRFGGLMRGEGDMPVCKHLLACLLVESCKSFKDFLEERVVERAELSGWAAGWSG